MKKFCSMFRMSVLLTIVLVVTICSISVFAAKEVANSTNSKITIDGVEVKFDAYVINGNNYFKLRDIAYSLKDTQKRFSVNWVAESNSANLITGESYIPVGGEMKLGNNAQKTATLSDTNIMINGNAVKATAYVIDNSNYFKLRDLGTLLNFGVNWDADTKTVEIISAAIEITCTEKEKVDLESTQTNNIENFGRDSVVQQFLYKDEGMAYAYENGNNLEIVLPGNKISVEKLYPIFADIISDKDGNIYVIWGRISEKIDNKIQPAVFVSKYSSAGELILTRGSYDPWEDKMHYVSKQPFYGANTVSAINNNDLVIFYGKTIHDNDQQFSGVYVVDLNYLSTAVTARTNHECNRVLVSDSFGNDIVWHDKLNEFWFVSANKTTSRGFNISSRRTGTPGYNASTKFFDFYLQPAANNNKDIINQTFAQMGGAVYTDNGLVFCGASAKSIGEDAKKEGQNLFIQLFDVDWNGKFTYAEGETRQGLTDVRFYDENPKMESVTNNGIIWLTDYAKESVVRPQIVKADDKIVILWSKYDPADTSCKKAFCMVLSADGKILVPETELDCRMNSYEKPIYHNGVVSWVYCDDSGSRLHRVNMQVK